jgi:hypothetical protein
VLRTEVTFHNAREAHSASGIHLKGRGPSDALGIWVKAFKAGHVEIKVKLRTFPPM